jgi:asparagine synthase (glutamine-hydrolysing)
MELRSFKYFCTLSFSIMCGITGFLDHNISFGEREDLINRMAYTIRHRGEEAGKQFHEGPVSFGHIRLKILDLSDQATQPMTIGPLTIVFNGEIYNYVEIRQILIKKHYTFKSNSDTEVILNAYKEWGEKCVDHFIGMWAFVIWDNESKTLFCSRDRFGIKPFYYIFDSGNFYFGSEYKPLKLCRLFQNEINIRQANRGLGLGFTSFRDESYFTRIKILEPSHNIVIKNNNLNIYRYWNLPVTKTNGISREEKNYIFSSMFLESLRLHMRSDVTIGNCLSGGLDSSSIVSAISKYYPEVNLKAFHIYYNGNNSAFVDEREFVYEVLNHYPGIQPHYFTPSDEELEPVFHSLMYYSDVPVHGSSYLSQFFLLRMASNNGVVVLIDGQGADEYLAGYMHSFYPLMTDYLKKLNLIKAFNIFKSHIRRQNYGQVQSLMVFLKTMLTLLKSEDIIFNYDLKKVSKIISEKEHKYDFLLNLDKYSSSAFDNFLFNMTFTTSLPTLLHYGDRSSMAHAIESRVPFLDHRLVEFMFSTHHEDKINSNSETKYLMRKSFTDFLPEKIANRKDKKGFVTPGEKVWLRGPLKHFLDIDYDRLHWLDKKQLQHEIAKYRKGDNTNAKLVWNICSLNQWLKQV